ncbi:Cytochrome c oxidase subunit 5B, mitochondrial [Malassezia vespertilionis]|uniref:Cytochrome c oxidase subunit 5B, mitochondrial n=1 Tax=Malassezia vespertilionis TaxID=2020962 RepID=UPI0024B1E5BD|nr:Cytochrome c oxidase subunit 5B, mitochondrial [Malassezia vespertilionis]WFD05323.1 Cytochrome c oxidase subunit 5B, mitochondrial [Malassezia vespertilionis]
MPTKRERLPVTTMIGSVRAALPRLHARNALLSARSIHIKSERWTPSTVRDGNMLIEQQSSIQAVRMLPNIENRWANLSKEEQYSLFKYIEEVQRKDWKELSLPEQRAGMYFLCC